MKTDKVFAELRDAIKTSPDNEVTPAMKNQITAKVEAAEERVRSALETDPWIYRFVVWFLGVGILACLFFTFYLLVINRGQEVKMPEIFLAIGSAAVGALAGLLAPSPMGGSK